MKHVLAIDGGGTKADALLVGEDGAILRQGFSTAQSSFAKLEGGWGRSAESVLPAMLQAINGTQLDDLHIVSNVHVGDLDVLKDRANHISVHPASEHTPPLEFTPEGFGIVVNAGTGAMMKGLTSDGRQLILDGLGPELGDYGSAYHIGTLAVKAVAKCDWHTRYKTSLEDAVYELTSAWSGRKDHLGLRSFMSGKPDRSTVASVAKLVDDHASAGDTVAQGILKEAAEALFSTLRDLIDRLDIRGNDYPVVLLGSVLAKSTIYRNHFCSLIKDYAPNFIPVLPIGPPVVGVALWGLKKLDVDNFTQAKNKLLADARALFETDNNTR